MRRPSKRRLPAACLFSALVRRLSRMPCNRPGTDKTSLHWARPIDGRPSAGVAKLKGLVAEAKGIDLGKGLS